MGGGTPSRELSTSCITCQSHVSNRFSMTVLYLFPICIWQIHSYTLPLPQLMLLSMYLFSWKLNFWTALAAQLGKRLPYPHPLLPLARYKQELTAWQFDISLKVSISYSSCFSYSHTPHTTYPLGTSYLSLTLFPFLFPFLSPSLLAFLHLTKRTQFANRCETIIMIN